MKKLIAICFLVLLVMNSMAQRRKSVFLEVLGNGLIVSGNFDMRLKPGRPDGFGFRAGVGGGTFTGNDDQGNVVGVGIVTLPLTVNYLVGKRRSYFESGIGITPVYVTASGRINDNIFSGSGLGATGFLNLGYRFQPLKNGVMGHIKWTPAFNSSGFSPAWFGVGVGYSFK